MTVLFAVFCILLFIHFGWMQFLRLCYIDIIRSSLISLLFDSVTMSIAMLTIAIWILIVVCLNYVCLLPFFLHLFHICWYLVCLQSVHNQQQFFFSVASTLFWLRAHTEFIRQPKKSARDTHDETLWGELCGYPCSSNIVISIFLSCNLLRQCKYRNNFCIEMTLNGRVYAAKITLIYWNIVWRA